MPKFSARSKRNLMSCSPALERLFLAVIAEYDCAVICGHRGEAAQSAAYHSGRSQTPWPRSRHNVSPSLAADVVPYPIDWGDTKRFYHFGGYVLGVAHQLSIPVRWGGDWNRNFKLSDQRFFDLSHFEVPEPAS